MALKVGKDTLDMTVLSSQLDDKISYEFLDDIEDKFEEIIADCPHCGEKSSRFKFSVSHFHLLPSQPFDVLESYLTFECKYCSGLLLQTIRFLGKMDTSDLDDIIYSNPQWQKTFPPIEYDIPEEFVKYIKPKRIYEDYKKALEHLYVKEHEYACTDLRKSLESLLNKFLKDQGDNPNTIQNAGQKIEKIKWAQKGESLKDIAIAIKNVGNLGPHPNSNNIKAEDVKLALQLMKLLLEHEFIMPKNVKKLEKFSAKKT